MTSPPTVQPDTHRRVNELDNAFFSGSTSTQIANFAFTLDNDGNPLTQTATGIPAFASDDRTFTSDRLNRLKTVTYAERNNATETLDLDTAGNRVNYTGRAGCTVPYELADEANEYGGIGGSYLLEYDEAGNLKTDEDGRGYIYDEHNRLTEAMEASSSNRRQKTGDLGFEPRGRVAFMPISIGFFALFEQSRAVNVPTFCHTW